MQARTTRDPELEVEWRRRVEEWRQSGQNVRAFCKERGLNEQRNQTSTFSVPSRRHENCQKGVAAQGATIVIQVPYGDQNVGVLIPA